MFDSAVWRNDPKAVVIINRIGPRLCRSIGIVRDIEANKLPPESASLDSTVCHACEQPESTEDLSGGGQVPPDEGADGESQGLGG